MVVLGSCQMFHDSYLDKEENSKVLDLILQYLSTDSIQLNAVDMEDAEVFAGVLVLSFCVFWFFGFLVFCVCISPQRHTHAQMYQVADYHNLPNTAVLAEELRVCLQEGDEAPRDFTTLFDQDLFRLDFGAVTDAVRAFKTLHIEHDPLRIIPPTFETPLPPLTPAVWGWPMLVVFHFSN
jgi:intraflagellar transport protein 52